jgi:hypothetical protein
MQDDGGSPHYGTFDIDGGATVEFLVPVIEDGGWATAATAISGSVVLNQVDTTVVGGNFDVVLQPADGGPLTDLSGLFTAANCLQ